MLIRHIGHAEFLIETENAVRIVTDPYDAGCGYPIRPVGAEIALVSHHHHDHDAVENLQGKPVIIDQAGLYTPAEGVRITAVRGYHDDEQGAKRGETLGDLGEMLNDEQVSILHDPDVLMIPVGGFYTIDGRQAQGTAARLNAKVILPMHYRTKYNAEWPISGPEVFLGGYPKEEVCEGTEALRVTKKDMMCQPKVVLFDLNS